MSLKLIYRLLPLLAWKWLANDVKKYDTTKLIDFLLERNLRLNEDDEKIIRNEKINGGDFLDTTKEELIGYGIKGETRKVRVRLKNYGSLVVDSLEAMRNEYVVAILHTAINVTRDSTGEELSMRPEYEVISDESTGRVDFANFLAFFSNTILAFQEAENLICVTEDKPEWNLIEVFPEYQTARELIPN